MAFGDRPSRAPIQANDAEDDWLLPPLIDSDDGCVYDGLVVKPGPGLRTRLEEALRTKASIFRVAVGEVRPTLPIAFDKNTAWSKVVAVIDSVRKVGVARVLLLLEGQSSSGPPPVASNTDLLRHSQHAFLWISDAGCRGLAELASARRRPWSTSCPAQETADAFQQCGCVPGLLEVQNWLWGRNERFETPTTFLAMELRGDADANNGRGSRVRLPATMPWSEAWKKLEPLHADGAPVLEALPGAKK